MILIYEILNLDDFQMNSQVRNTEKRKKGSKMHLAFRETKFTIIKCLGFRILKFCFVKCALRI